LHHPTNAGVKATAKPKAPALWTHFNQGAHLWTKQLQVCCAHFPESLFDRSIIWGFSNNCVSWPGKWANELT